MISHGSPQAVQIAAVPALPRAAAVLDALPAVAQTLLHGARDAGGGVYILCSGCRCGAGVKVCGGGLCCRSVCVGGGVPSLFERLTGSGVG